MGALYLIREPNRKRGRSVRFITVNFGVVAEIVDRVAKLQRGDVVEDAAASDVLAKSQQADTQSLLDVVPERDWISGLPAAV
jgi:ABC-type dipeptide/oligopeptide/nickel transport system ATPase component